MMVMMMWLEHNEIMSICITFRLSKCNRLTIDEKILWILTQEYSYSIKRGHIYNWGSRTAPMLIKGATHYLSQSQIE